MVALDAAVAQEVRRGYADHDAERPERHRDHRPAPGANPGIGGSGGREQQDRDQPADEMAARSGAGLGLDEVVVQHMHRDHGDAEHHDRAFAACCAPVAGGSERLRPGASGPRADVVVVPLRSVRVSAIASPQHPGRGALPYRTGSSSGTGRGASSGSSGSSGS